MKTRVLFACGVAFLGALALVAQPSAQGGAPGQPGQPSPQGQPQEPRGRGRGQAQAPGAAPESGVRVLQIRANVYMLAGDGANVTVQLPPVSGLPPADAGLLLVDTGVAPMSGALIAAVRQLAGTQPLRFIFNTSMSPDHVGGNDALAKALGPSAGRGRAAATSIAAHENVLTRMSASKGGAQPLPFGSWPTDTFLDRKELYFNDEGIQAFHVPNANTDGDSLVFFRRTDVISTGDLFMTTTYPMIDLAKGGNVAGIIQGLNQILDLAIPATYEQGGTLIVPGHGRLCDEADVVEYRNMVVIVRDRIQDLVKKGMTIEQVKAAKPTLDYDRRYGAQSGPWTTAAFIEAVYKNVGGK